MASNETEFLGTITEELRRHLLCTLAHDNQSDDSDFDRNYFY
ncbi:MAG: hypothetical protein ACI87E_005307, partial [Mariniblastus sp.]